MKTTFDFGSLEWLEMKRYICNLAFVRAMDAFDIDAANRACARLQYYDEQIAAVNAKNSIAANL